MTIFYNTRENGKTQKAGVIILIQISRIVDKKVTELPTSVQMFSKTRMHTDKRVIVTIVYCNSVYILTRQC